MIRRHPVVDGQTHPAELGHVRHQRVALQDPAAVHPGAAGHEDHHRRGLGGQLLAAATRRAAARGCRRSAPRSGTRCGGARAPSTPAACESGAGHSMSRASAGTTPRSAFCTTSLVLSRSRLRSSAMPGVNHDLHGGPEEVRHVANAPDAHRRHTTEWLEVFADHREATSTPRSWPAGSPSGPASSNHLARVASVGPGYRVSGRAVMARAYPGYSSVIDNVGEVVYHCTPRNLLWPASQARHAVAVVISAAAR